MRRGLWVLKFIVCVVAMVLVLGYVTMSLWNWLIPMLFAGPMLTFWQTLGLLLLSKIFLWSFHKSGGHHRGGPWKHYMRRKWNGMNPEEREALRTKMKERWCKWDTGSESDDKTGSNG